MPIVALATPSSACQHCRLSHYIAQSMNQPQHAPFPELSRSQVAWIIFSLLVAGWFLWRLGPVLTPFFISVLIAYIVNPLVGQLERLKIQRSLEIGRASCRERV